MFGILILAALATAAYFSKIVRFVLRVITYVWGLLMASIVGMAIAVYCGAHGRWWDTNHYVGLFFNTLLSPLLGVEYTVEGKEHLSTSPAVFVCNHQSSLDLLPL
jgi:lysophosphatidate acyltransferase